MQNSAKIIAFPLTQKLPIPKNVIHVAKMAAIKWRCDIRMKMAQRRKNLFMEKLKQKH